MQTIEIAIAGKHLLDLTYESTEARHVEPHVLYQDSAGELYLGVYQRSGYSRRGEATGWKALKIQNITSLHLLEERFSPRSDFNPTDRSNYHKVILQVT